MPLKSLFINRKEEELESDERVILSDPANLFDGLSVGGRLTLTNKRLIFRPHRMNLNQSDVRIDIEDIIGVQKVVTLRFYHSSLLVTTEDGSELKFVLGNHRDKWFEALKD